MPVDYQQLTAQQSSPTWTLTAAEVRQQAKELVAKDIAFYDRIAAITEPTIENVLVPSIEYENENGFQESRLTFYSYVASDQELRDASTEAEQLIDENSIVQASRVDVFQVYKSLWEKIDDMGPVDAESRKWLEKTVQGFRRNGLDLPAEQRAEVQRLKIELSSLCTAFSKNTNEENGHVAFTRADLEGVPDEVLEQFETTTDGATLKYKVTFKYPDILPVLKYARNQKTRETAFVANSNKVPQNAAILDKMVRLRFQIARVLGYDNYAAYVLEQRMAKTPEHVADFLADLQEKLQPLAKDELARLLEFKNADLAARGLPAQDQYYAWDHSFYDNLLLEKEYSVDHQKIAEYFPLDQTIAKMLGFYETLFDVKFVTVASPERDTLWHEDVHKVAVYQNIKFGEPKNEFMGWILFDLHPREGKYTHAAHFGLQSPYVKRDGSRAPNYAALVCNFTKPTKTKPSLLKHSEVTTFFHELGHGVHNLLSRTKLARFQGTHVPRDFVECPSQMLEFWTWSQNELRALSGHYETGEPIPDDLIGQLISSKHVNTGIFNCRQLHYGLFDMKLHTMAAQEDLDTLDITKLWNSLREEVTLISNGGQDNVGYATFGHIAGGYEAGYYGYLYSQVFATDIYYTHFKADPMNVQKGLRYRDVILKNGGALEIADILEELLGRKPNAEAFLEEILGH